MKEINKCSWHVHKILDIRQFNLSKMTNHFSFIIQYFVMGDKQTRTVLSVEEKLATFNYKQNRPDETFENIGKIFTERWNKRICKKLAFSSYHLIKTHRENGLEINSAEEALLRFRPKKSLFLSKNCTIPSIIVS